MSIAITDPHDPVSFGCSHVARVSGDLALIAGQYDSDAAGHTATGDFAAHGHGPHRAVPRRCERAARKSQEPGPVPGSCTLVDPARLAAAPRGRRLCGPGESAHLYTAAKLGTWPRARVADSGRTAARLRPEGGQAMSATAASA